LKVGFAVDDKRFRIRFLDMNTADCYPLLPTVPLLLLRQLLKMMTDELLMIGRKA